MAKIPQVFSQTCKHKSKKKKSKRSRHKKVKKTKRRREYSSDSSGSSSEEDTRPTTRHSAGGTFPYFNPLYSFPGQSQGYHNPVPFFYQPLQPYPQMSGIQQRVHLANSDTGNNFVQNTNLCNTVPLRGTNVGSATSSSMTSTTKSSVSSLHVNDGESWSNLNTLVAAAVSFDDQNSE